MKSTAFILIILLSFYCNAQETKLTGTVTDTDGIPLENVTVYNTSTKRWTLTNELGKFSIKVIASSHSKLTFSLLGKQEETKTFDASTTHLKVVLKNKDLRLDDVIVAARKGQENSEIILEQEAVNQVQAFSLNEVLEQLPGQSITNLNLNEFKPIVFRSAKANYISTDPSFGNKSLGTAIVVDGIPISNNANMQSYIGNSGSPFSPNYFGFGDSGSSGFNGYFSNANFGADLREIPTENIEKIEVVQGIPSAKYGDLTSGLIKIEQKAGKSPYRMYVSLRDGTTEGNIAKGLSLGKKAGNLNLSLNYVSSNSAPRTSFTKYNRITTYAMWSWLNSSKTISNSFSVNYSFNNDDVNYEEEDADDKMVKNKKKAISISNRFKWNIKTTLFDNINANINFSYADQYTYESQLINSGGNIVSTSTEEGVYTGIYTPVNYRRAKAIEGIPITTYASIDFNKALTSGKWVHNISYGTSIRTSDNKGRGRLGSPETLDNRIGNSATGEGSNGFRPYNYGDNVKSEYQFSVYVEDNILKNYKKGTFRITPGLRYDNQNNFSILNPRLNTSFATKKIKFRGGFGLTSKTPSLNLMYSGPSFYDVVLGDYRLPGYYNLGIVQTFIDYNNNKKLKPSRSLRTEVGIDFALPFGALNITGFYNHLYDGFTSQSYPIIRELADLNIIYNGNETPDYEINDYTSYYYLQNKMVNKQESSDTGVEFFASFQKLPFENLTLDIQGSFVKTKSLNNVDNYLASTNADSNEKYGVFKPNYLNLNQFSLSGNLSYHLPQIGLIMAIRSEHFIINDVDYANNLYPYAYINTNLDKVIIPESDRSNTNLYGHIIRASGTRNNTKLDKVYHNFHLRISKDFLNGFRFSFYANNFLDLKPTETTYYNGTYVKQLKSDMVSLSFGTKIEYNF